MRSEEHSQPEVVGPMPRYFYALVILGVAFAFQGARGIWEPDEGRYVNGALAMLDGGDWFVPELHGLVYLDKPPAIYWAIAFGIKILGSNEWGVRLAHGLSLVGTAILIGAWVRPAVGRQGARVAAAAYATSLLPMLAANAVTPDALLALSTTASLVAYWHYRCAPKGASRYLWAAALGLALASGLFIKGTAALIFAAPIVLHLAWQMGPLKAIRRPDLWLVLGLALGLGSLWYLEVGRRVPGALDYFFDNQVAGRLWKSIYQRNAEWWKPFKIYGAAIVAGSLPWSLLWPRLLLRKGARRLGELVAEDALSRFMLLAIVVPLLVLSLAKSRLELYALPVLPAIIGLTVVTFWRSGIPIRWRRMLAIAALAMITVKWTAADWPTDRDSRRLASQLTALEIRGDACIEVLNEKAHGLRLYGFDDVGWHTTHPEAYPYFQAPSMLNRDMDQLAKACDGKIFLVSLPRHLEFVAGNLSSSAWHCDDPQRLNGRLSLQACQLADPEVRSRTHSSATTFTSSSTGARRKGG